MPKTDREVVNVPEKMTLGELLRVVNYTAKRFEEDNPEVEIETLFLGCSKEANVTIKEKK